MKSKKILYKMLLIMMMVFLYVMPVYADKKPDTLPQVEWETVESSSEDLDNTDELVTVIEEDKGFNWIIPGIIAGAGIVTAIVIISGLKKRKNTLINSRLSEYKVLAEKRSMIYKKCAEELLKTKKLKEQMEICVLGTDAKSGLANLTSLLSEEQKNWFDVRKVADHNYMSNTLAKSEEIKAALLDRFSDMAIEEESFNNMKMNPSNRKLILKNLGELCKKEQSNIKVMERYLLTLREENGTLNEKLQQLKNHWDILLKMNEKPIMSDLVIQDIAGFPGLTGAMSAKLLSGEYRKGGFCLDEIPLLGEARSLGNLNSFGASDLYVYGLTGRKGLLLCRSKEFYVKSLSGDKKMVNELELISGNDYELIVPVGKEMLSFKLSVR